MASDINSAVVSGNLTRDPELRHTESGFAIGNFAIACTRTRKVDDEFTDEVSYFDVKVFGNKAENVSKKLRKGDLVSVSGRLEQERWEDKETGAKRSKVVIIAEQMSGEGFFRKAGEEPARSEPEAKQEALPAASADDDDIPF